MAGFPPVRALLRNILWASVLGCAWRGFAAVPSSELFPAQCTVLLLAGLAGDSESENAYHEQLKDWVELIQGRAEPHHIILLCEHPESLGWPSAPQLELMPANRTNFIHLAGALTRTTNPVVVIAFGHGGRQGATPVFHVPGPRLTPGDFASFAAQLPQSRWILWFRGSGAFARALASESRQILSSECDTAFSSDPVGMALLLRLAQANPAVSFPEVATKAGQAIASWYSSRNLARTEEPTFWDSDQKPKLLAPADTKAGESTQAAAPGPEEGAQNSERHTENTSGARGERPAAWKEITPVRSQEYPESDGIVLRRKLRCVIGDKPAVATDQEEYIQILSAEGKSLGDFDVAYSPPEEELEFLACEVLRPDGQVVQLDPEAIGSNQEPPAGEYQTARRRFFSLPDVVPGAVLHVHYRTQWKEFPLPHVAMALPIDLDLPVLDSTIQVSLPNQTPFHFLFDGLSAADPVISRTDYSTSYTWHFEKQAEHRREVLSSPGQAPRLLFSTFAGWQAFAEWYERISRLADEATPEIVAKAQELTRSSKSDRDKVAAIYNYVSSLRYVAIPLGVNSLRPHAAANVLQHQFGDCKDKANLLNALLRASNLQAQLVLVPRFSQAYDVVPGIGFNHAISRVNLNGEALWIDSTDDICRFGLLPPGDPGRHVLVIDGRATALTQLPEPDPQQHHLRIAGELQAAEAAETWAGTLTAQAHGYPDYELREVARETKEHHRAAPLLAARFRPVNGSFALESQTASSVSAMTEDFAWHAQGSFVGLSSLASGESLLRAPVWLPREWDAALHRRLSPLFLNQGYPLTLDEQFTMILSPSSSTRELPRAQESKEGPLRWSVEWTKVSDGKLVSHVQAQLVRGELSLAETTAFQQQLRSLMIALSANATFVPAR